MKASDATTRDSHGAANADTPPHRPSAEADGSGRSSAKADGSGRSSAEADGAGRSSAEADGAGRSSSDDGVGGQMDDKGNAAGPRPPGPTHFIYLVND